MTAVKCIQIPIVPLTKRKERTLSELLEAYRNIVQQSVDYAMRAGATSRKRLHEALYGKLRGASELSFALRSYSLHDGLRHT